jgi:hypothetical protein
MQLQFYKVNAVIPQRGRILPPVDYGNKELWLHAKKMTSSRAIFSLSYMTYRISLRILILP